MPAPTVKDKGCVVMMGGETFKGVIGCAPASDVPLAAPNGRGETQGRGFPRGRTANEIEAPGLNPGGVQERSGKGGGDGKGKSAVPFRKASKGPPVFRRAIPVVEAGVVGGLEYHCLPHGSICHIRQDKGALVPAHAGNATHALRWRTIEKSAATLLL